MGIFESLIGTNSTAATDGAVSSQIPYLWDATRGANKVLRDQYGQARTDLTGNANSAQRALSTGYDAGRTAVSGYGDMAQGILSGRTDQAAGLALAGNEGFSPYATAGAGATGTLADALGLNGAAGHDRATSAFQASPGYGFQVDQATDAAARKAASLGIAGSGGTLDAITRLGSNLANQEYGSWLTNLSNLGTQGLAAQSGISANDRGAASHYGTAGTTGATLANSTGSQLGTLDANGANQKANVFTGVGTQLGAYDTNLGQSIAQNNIDTSRGVFGAIIGNAQRQDAATNANNSIFSKLIGGALSLPMGGGASLGGSLLSKLGSTFQL